MIRASAPGKAVLSGEYAVLTGSPAASMALDRRARVTVCRARAKHHSVSARGYIDTRCRFDAKPDGSLNWLDEPPIAGAFALFECIWKRCAADPGQALDIRLDTRAFFDADGGRKLGIGSSSAVAVAASAALMRLTGNPKAAFSKALDAHRTFQHGKGSGVDIATAWRGGLIGYRRESPITDLHLPADLYYRFFWSGRCAGTVEKLDRLGKAIRTPAESALADASSAAMLSIQSGAGSDFLSVMKSYVDVLSIYDSERGLGIFAAGHRLLADDAGTFGDLVYKPCGAGGGDIGVAFAASAQALEEFARHAQTRHFVALDVKLDHQGVLVEVS